MNVDAFMTLYKFEELIGYGQCSRIYLASHIESGHRFCAKVILKSREKAYEPGRLRRVVNPIESVNVVQLLSIFEDECVVIILTPADPANDIYSYILENPEFREKDLAVLIQQILLGLEALHNRGIIHRDLKPNNILIMEANERPLVKLIDYGFGDLIDSNTQFSEIANRSLFTSPELFKKVNVSFPTDIWSLGSILFTLLTGRRLFPVDEKIPLIMKLQEGIIEFPEDCDDFSDAGQDLVRRMLKINPNDRITVQEALEHPWITGNAEYNPNPMVKMLEHLTLLASVRKLQQTMAAAKAARYFRQFTVQQDPIHPITSDSSPEVESSTDNTTDPTSL